MPADPERRSKLCAALAEAGLDGLVCSAPSDILLLTGYWPVMGVSLAALSRDGSCAIVLPDDEQELATRSSGDRQIPYKPETLSCLEALPLSLREPLETALKHTGIAGGAIGLREQVTEQPMSYVVGADFHQSLLTLLKKVDGNGRFAGCDDLLEDQKDAKTKSELATMRTACDMARPGFDAAPAAIQAGFSERVVAAAIQQVFDSAPLPTGVVRSYGTFFCMSGPNSAKASAAFAQTRDRTLESGDLVMIHTNTCTDGFWTDITRTYTVGEPQQRHREMRAAIMQARRAALETIAPGVLARDVDHAARSIMEQHGFGNAFRHATGHGVGFAAASGEARPRVHPVSTDVLREGSTFNVEPAAYFADYGGMRHCDVVAVVDGAARVLSDFDLGDEA